MTIIQLNVTVNSDSIPVDEFMIQSDNWAEACALFDTFDQIPVQISNGYDTVDGSAIKNGSIITVNLDETITMPRGACIEFLTDEVEESDDDDEECTPLTETSKMSDALRFAIVDNDGCVTEYVTIEAIRDYLLQDIITDACDLFASPDTQPLVAGDEFVAINGCNLKRISQSDVKCPED